MTHTLNIKQKGLTLFETLLSLSIVIWYGEQSAWSQPAGLHTHTITVDNFGGPETRPKNMALLACMKK